MRVTCIAALVALTAAFTPTPRVTAPKMRTKLRAGATDLTPTQRTALLGSLIGVYTSNQWCRQLLFSTVDFTSDDAFRFLNVGLELSRADYALLSTLTFNALFAACSLAAGALVDRADAVKLTYVSSASGPSRPSRRPTHLHSRASPLVGHCRAWPWPRRRRRATRS